MIPQKTGGQPYIFPLKGAEGQADIIQPGEAKLFSFTFDREQFDVPAVEPEDAPCTLDIVVTSFSGRFDGVTRDVSCDEIRYLFNDQPRPPDRRGLLPEEGPMPSEDRGGWR
jgi:hypothetical protein